MHATAHKHVHGPALHAAAACTCVAPLPWVRPRRARSQPPLLSQMVRAVYAATNSTSLLEEAYGALLTEHAYWTSPPKTFTVAAPQGAFNFSRYYAEWDQPRPESYLCGPACLPCCMC